MRLDAPVPIVPAPTKDGPDLRKNTHGSETLEAEKPVQGKREDLF